ncbi:hypothetical protein Taro_051945 [Colocasia esculenta]|uniref:HMA domain-containing protein n=1 Tax=Colocasia esculenta TaxID=4460 RepID=A0A843XI91_COLES|nr:hypothetical protein [Colocasia esculenta]
MQPLFTSSRASGVVEVVQRQQRPTAAEMTKDEDFKLLKIQTVVLKVNIHCDGCKLEVKKLLQKIEGVYTVHIDADHQKVTVSGNVDSATLIKRLARSGKHAELWSQKPGGQNKQQQQQQQNNHQKPQQASALKLGGKNAKDQQKQNLMKGIQAFKNQHKKASSFSSDDEDNDDEDDEDEREDDFAFLGNKLNQINLLAQANAAAAAAAAAANAQKKNGGNANGNNPGGGKKKGSGGAGAGGHQNPNHHQGMKHHSNGAEQKGAHTHPVATAGGKMAGVGHHTSGGGHHMGGNQNGPGKMAPPMAGLGLNGLAFPQAQQQQPISFQGHHPSGVGPALGAATGGFGGGPAHQHQAPPMMMNLQGFQSHPASSMMMGPSRPSGMMVVPDSGRYMQPQMMYHRSPQVTPYTGYYPPPYYNPAPPPPYYFYPSQYHQSSSEASDYGAHLFSDENTNSCAVM